MKTLEGNNAFPYIAWTTLVLFSLFTYSLVLNLRTTLSELDEQTEITVSATKKPQDVR